MCRAIGILLLLALALPGRGDTILAHGTVASLSGTDPALNALHPTYFDVRIDFAPTGYDHYGLHGPADWSVLLDSVTELTDFLPVPPVSSLTFGENLAAEHMCVFGGHSGSWPGPSCVLDLRARFTPSFDYTPPPYGQNDGNLYPAYVISDLAGFLGGTLNYSADTGSSVETLVGTVTVFSYAVPEPGTLGLAAIGMLGVLRLICPNILQRKAS